MSRTETDQESVLWVFIWPDSKPGYVWWLNVLSVRRKVTSVYSVVWAALGVELPTYPFRGIKLFRSSCFSLTELQVEVGSLPARSFDSYRLGLQLRLRKIVRKVFLGLLCGGSFCRPTGHRAALCPTFIS